MNSNDYEFFERLKEWGPVRGISNLLCRIDRRVLIDIIIISIPIILIYIYVSFEPSKLKETLKQNKVIDKKIDSIMDNNKFIMERMFELESKQIVFLDMVNENNFLIRENNRELVNLKRIYNEKINSVNNFNISQLDSFFTTRYKDYYSK